MADIFISYARRDRDRVMAVVECLRAHWTIFVDEEGLDSSALFAKQLAAEIEAARIVLVFWSEASVDSAWIWSEAQLAFKRGKLIAARLDAIEPPLGLDGIHAVDVVGFRRGEHHPGIDRILQLINAWPGVGEVDLDKSDATAMRRLRKRIRETRTSALFALALAFATVCVVASVPEWVPMPRMWLLSLCQVAPLVESDTLRVVVIDKQSERALESNRIETGLASGDDSAEVGAFGPRWRALVARASARISESKAAVIALDIAFTEAPDSGSARVATTALANAITTARARGTALVLLATSIDEHTRKLALLPEIQAAVLSPAKGAGLLAHGCVGKQEGFAVLLPLLFTAKPPRYSLALSSVASLEQRTASWNPGDSILSFEHEGEASLIAFTGLGPELQSKESHCSIVEPGQRAVYRVLDPFPRELKRGDRRVIPFEDIVDTTRARYPSSELEKKIVLVGRQYPDADLHESCGADGCHDIHGLSLHAAAIDTLSRGGRAIQIISARAQLCWLTLLCSLGAGLRFATARQGRLARFGLLAGLIALDVALSLLLATQQALLVDTLHHIAALGLCYYIVSRIEPTRA